MAALSSVFLRPRALMGNPFPLGTRREDFMRTTGVYRCALVGGGGGGGGQRQIDTAVYYGEAGLSAQPYFLTIRVRDGVIIESGSGGAGGAPYASGGAGGSSTLAGETTLSADGGRGGASSAASIVPLESYWYGYTVQRGGARPAVSFNTSVGTMIALGRGGGSGLSGNPGGMIYDLIYRVA